MNLARLSLCALALTACSAAPSLSPSSAAKNRPQAPFRIAGDVYYVGASDVASYLIVTPQGMILLDGGFAQTAPMIETHIAALGFRLQDVKILLNGHAHPDHAGGLAQLKRDTAASFEAMSEEVAPLEHEGRGTFYRGDKALYQSIHVDRVLEDGDTVSLGGVTLTAHLTAGHTPGCTSWSMQVTEGGTPYSAVFFCQLTLPDKLLGNPLYPAAAQDYARSFQVLETLPCDVFLAEHGSAFDLLGKYARLQAHPEANPFVDPAGCKAYLEQSRQAFEAQLASEQAATGH
jgi:metallo-beta-lactamase class B